MLHGTEEGTPCYDLGVKWSPQFHVFEQLVLSWWHYFGETVTSFGHGIYLAEVRLRRRV